MEQRNLIKQMVDFNKTAVDSMFNTAAFFQEQSERLGGMMLANSPLGFDQAKKWYEDSAQVCKKGRENVKKMMDEGFKTMESLLMQQAASMPGTKQSQAEEKSSGGSSSKS